ncbi:hypothetical protein P3L51_24550 [Streptomyces sp. PSRA5]|uniref:hypothetical protein n=1 Tax=Streptomyces panacea TaxID=3035064 RepID=UPI00339CC05D
MNTRTFRRAAAYLPAAALIAAATAAAATGWWLAGLVLAGASGILYAEQSTARRTSPAPGGYRTTDATALHTLYRSAIAGELHRQAAADVDPATAEGTECLAASALTVRDAELETAYQYQSDLIRRLGTATSELERTTRQARYLIAMWENNTEGPDAPGLHRAATELRDLTRADA